MAQFQDSLDWQAPDPTRFSKQMESKFLGLHGQACLFQVPNIGRSINQKKMGFSPNPWYIRIDNPQAFKENVPVAMHQQSAGYENARFCWVSTMTFDELDFWQRWTTDHSGPWEIISSWGIQPDSRLGISEATDW